MSIHCQRNYLAQSQKSQALVLSLPLPGCAPVQVLGLSFLICRKRELSYMTLKVLPVSQDPLLQDDCSGGPSLPQPGA